MSLTNLGMEQIVKRITIASLFMTGFTLAACRNSATAPTPAYEAAEVASAGALQGFGFNSKEISGFPPGVVFLTGGGSYDAATASNTVPSITTRVHASGGFRCLDDIAQLPLLGCKAGEGVRWDTRQLLVSSVFKCSATDTPKTAFTGSDTVVVLADFYRAGDGNEESFTAPMIVSSTDLAPGIPGEQNVWIKGVGCGTAVVHFSQ